MAIPSVPAAAALACSVVAAIGTGAGSASPHDRSPRQDDVAAGAARGPGRCRSLAERVQHLQTALVPPGHDTGGGRGQLTSTNQHSHSGWTIKGSVNTTATLKY